MKFYRKKKVNIGKFSKSSYPDWLDSWREMKKSGNVASRLFFAIKTTWQHGANLNTFQNEFGVPSVTIRLAVTPPLHLHPRPPPQKQIERKFDRLSRSANQVKRNQRCRHWSLPLRPAGPKRNGHGAEEAAAAAGEIGRPQQSGVPEERLQLQDGAAPARLAAFRPQPRTGEAARGLRSPELSSLRALRFPRAFLCSRTCRSGPRPAGPGTESLDSAGPRLRVPRPDEPLDLSASEIVLDFCEATRTGLEFSRCECLVRGGGIGGMLLSKCILHYSYFLARGLPSFTRLHPYCLTCKLLNGPLWRNHIIGYSHFSNINTA